MSIPDKSKESTHSVQIVTYPTKLLYFLLILNSIMIVMVFCLISRSKHTERELDIAIAMARSNQGRNHTWGHHPPGHHHCGHQRHDMNIKGEIASIEKTQNQIFDLLAVTLKQIRRFESSQKETRNFLQTILQETRSKNPDQTVMKDMLKKIQGMIQPIQEFIMSVKQKWSYYF